MRSGAFIAIGIAALMLFGVFAGCVGENKQKSINAPEQTEVLPERYMIFVEEPKTEADMAFAASLSCLAVHNGYNPMFVLQNGSLDDHQVFTINSMSISDVPKLLFTNDDSVASKVSSQVSNVVVYPADPTSAASFKGFDGAISVGSYEEALWVSPLAAVQNKAIYVGGPTFTSQEEVWEALNSTGIDCSYLVVANAQDWNEMGEILPMGVNGTWGNASFHVKSLSLMGAQLAAYYKGYVMTRWDPVDYIPNALYNFTLNRNATGLLCAIRNFNMTYGPLEYVCLVGSAEAVPQFQLPDWLGGEADKLVNCDVMYGFLNDEFNMTAAVGRIINLNIQGASNQISRTLGYEYLLANDASGWHNTGGIFNGYGVVDERLQTSPGVCLMMDMYDEGMTPDYYSTIGEWDLISANPFENLGYVFYRGHGSWKGCFYSWLYNWYYDLVDQGITVWDQPKGMVSGPMAREMFLPPMVTVITACATAKIQGMYWHYDDRPDYYCPVNQSFAPNWLYAGCVGYISATEISLSSMYQDLTGYTGEITGRRHWAMNNAWYAEMANRLFDNETSIGKAMQFAENNFLRNKSKYVSYTIVNEVEELSGTIAEKIYEILAEIPFSIPVPELPGPSDSMPLTPFYPMGDMGCWKEIAMYVCYGDPAFTPQSDNPGEGTYNPWVDGNILGTEI